MPLISVIRNLATASSDSAGQVAGTSAGMAGDSAGLDSSAGSEWFVWLAFDFLNQPWVGRAAAVLVSALLALGLYLLLQRGLSSLLRRHPVTQPYERGLLRGLRWFFVPLAALVVLQQAGVDLNSVWAVIAAALAMVAIGFVAVWSLLSNILAAALIMLTRLFRNGDDLELVEAGGADGLRGIVQDSHLLFTVLYQDGGPETEGPLIVKIPNNIFFQRILRLHPRRQAVADPEIARVIEREADREMDSAAKESPAP